MIVEDEAAQKARANKRRQITMELLDTEKFYVDNLKILIQYYIEPLRNPQLQVNANGTTNGKRKKRKEKKRKEKKRRKKERIEELKKKKERKKKKKKN